MKRIGICAALVLALAIPATALGARSVLFGSLDEQPESTLKIRTKSKHGKTTVRSIAFKDFAVPCDGHTAALKRSKLSGEIPVGGEGGFRARDDNGETVFKIRGEFDDDRERVEGSFRYSGELEAEDGVVRECDSGRLSWAAEAKRG